MMNISANPSETMDPLDETATSFCKECERDFHFYGLYEKHRHDVHGFNDPLTCDLCGTPFKRKMNLIIHLRSKPHRTHNFVGCDICDAYNVTNGFDGDDKLAEHTENVHGKGVLINAKEQSEYLCPLCRKRFTHRKGMIEHLQVLHQEHVIGDLLGEKGFSKQQWLDKKLYKCLDCEDKSFRVKSTLNRHREKFHKDYSHWRKSLNRPYIPKKVTEFLELTGTIERNPTLMDDEEFEDLEEVEDDEDVHGSKRKRSLPSDRIPIPKSMKRSLPTSLTVTMTKEASHISPNKKRQKPEERGRGSQRSHPNVIVRKLMESDAKDEDWKSAYKVQTTDGELRTSTRIRCKPSDEDKKDEPFASPDFVDVNSTDEPSTEDSLGHNPIEEEPKDCGEKRNKSPLPETQSYPFSSTVPRDPLAVESCAVEGCERTFANYYSMMRHMAFTHNKVRTMELMKLRPTMKQHVVLSN